MAQLLPKLLNRIEDANGNPVAGGKAYFYTTGTSTLATIYADSGLTTPLANPVVADAGGLLASIYLSSSVTYRMKYTDADDVTIRDIDPLELGGSGTALTNKANINGDNITDPTTFGQNIGLRRQAATVSAADPAAGLDAVSPELMTRGQSVQIDLPSGTIAMADAVAWQHPMSSAVKVRGVTPTSTTITSIVSVTGSAGAWTVVANVADASGISVGDGLQIRNVTPGWVTPGAYAARKLVAGEARMEFFSLGSVTTSGTTMTMSGSSGATYLDNGNLVSILGENRTISGVGASTATLNAALASSASPSLQYWYSVKEGAGTASCSVVTVTGTSTTYSSTANIGDMIWFKGSGVRRITAVGGNTSLTVDRALTTAGTEYGLMTCGWRHEGAFIVTAVSGNQVTWVNYNRTAASQPPVNLITGGDVTIYKTVLSATGSAFQVEGGNTLDLDDVFLVGPTGTTTVAFDLRGTDEASAGHLTLGSNVAVAKFGYGIRAGVGSRIYAVNTNWSGQTTRAINLGTMAKANMNAARISGANGIGIFIGDGSDCRHNATIVTGCADDGIRTEVGGAGWGDFSVASHNGAKGYHWVGGVLVHLVGSWAIGNIEEGFIGENGGFGRMTGLLALSNSVGISGGGHIECQQSFLGGNGNGLIATANGKFNANTSGSSYSVADNYQAIGGGADISVSAARAVGATDDGMAVSLGGKIYGSAPVFSGNGGNDAEAVTHGQIKVSSATGMSSTNITVNRFAADGALIANGAAAITQTPDYLEALGAPGVVVSALANDTTVLHTLTVTGATLNNSYGVTVNSNVIVPTGLAITAAVTATDTVTVYGTNPTGSNISVGNRTYRVRVHI